MKFLAQKIIRFTAAQLLMLNGFFLWPTAILASEFCKPHWFADGDTFYYRNSLGEQVKVRVAGFDAPERGQPFSRKATDAMKSLIAQGANCDCYKSDRYGRKICTVHTLDGENVVNPMLAQGLGCIDPRFVHEASAQDREAANEALAKAQQARLGIWSLNSPQCGYEFRREKAEQQKQ